MKNYIAAAVIALTLLACDAHFKIQGTIVSSAEQPLDGCWLVYESRGKLKTSQLTAPHFDGGFATDRNPKTVVITCDEHKPATVVVPQGGDVGTVVLAHRVGT